MCMNNLASTYRNQGRFSEAAKLQEQCVEIRTRELGKENPITLLTISNLAATYRNQGRLREAVILQEDCLKLRERTLGAEHPDTLMSMGNLLSGRLVDSDRCCIDI